ncbi:MAG: 50S ribosomal protein L6 [Candidatus Kerfeldbacteria bacterium]|nr:50S ribosomal protein L6 [Candidatus Kerfeldbacteria bacterium]
MSRIGKLPVDITPGVSVTRQGELCIIKGPKGELTLPMHERVRFEVGPDRVTVNVQNSTSKRDRALWGLFRVLLANAVEGVTKGFTKQLEVRGIGFRANVEGAELVLNLGYSHPVRYSIPSGITVAVEKNVVTISGIDKQLVGETAATIRRLRPPEPYKGKGFSSRVEFVRQKAGKVVNAAGVK